jgi:hypothetical protein
MYRVSSSKRKHRDAAYAVRQGVLHVMAHLATLGMCKMPLHPVVRHLRYISDHMRLRHHLGSRRNHYVRQGRPGF